MINRDITSEVNGEPMGSVFNGALGISYIPNGEKGKPCIVFQYDANGMHRGVQANFDELIHQCRGTTIDKHHAVSDGTVMRVYVSGYNSVIEAIKVLLDYANENKKTTKLNEKKLSNVLSDIISRREEVYKVKGKNMYHRKDASQNKDMEQSTVSQSAHNVKKQITPKNKIVYNKPQPGAISEIESFNSELFRLLLGTKRVGKVRSTYDSQGIRTGSVSREMEGYCSIKDYVTTNKLAYKLAVSPDKLKVQNELKNMLINGGFGKVEVANHVFADDDAHWGNVGINKQGEIGRIDFDRALWPITSSYAGIDPNKDRDVRNESVSPKHAFPVSIIDIVKLPNTSDTKPDNAMKYHVERDLYLDNSFLSSIQMDGKFIHDKWYAYLKYILINDEMYKSRLDYCISSEKRKNEILPYLVERRDAFKEKLLSIPEFRNYIIYNPDVIKNIIHEFNDLNETYKNKPLKKSLLIDITSITEDYINLSLKYLKNDYYAFLKNQNYPVSYTNLWDNQKSLSDNIYFIMNDYIEPIGGWFLSGHWSRGNKQQAENIIEWLKQYPHASDEDIQKYLTITIDEAKLTDEVNAMGSFVKRLEFSLKQIMLQAEIRVATLHKLK